MAKTVQKTPIPSAQLEPLLKAAALRRLQYEPAQRQPTATAPKASKAATKAAKPAKKGKKG